MEPIVYNNMPNQDPKAGLPANNSGAGSASSVINFPNGITEQAIISYAKTRNGVFEKWFKQYIDMIAVFHKMWLNKNTGDSKGTKPVPLPFSHSIIESVNARLASVLFNRPKYIDALPQQVTADNTKQKIVEDFVNQELKDISPQPDKGKAAVKAALLDSFFIWRNVWTICTDKVSIPQYQPVGPMMMGPDGPKPSQNLYMGDQEQTVTYQHWDWELKNPENMAWDPHCTTKIQNSSWVRERTRMSYNQLMKWQEEGRVGNIDVLLTVTPAGINPGMKKDWESTLKEADGDKNWAFTYGDEKEFKVEEWFAEITYKGPVQPEAEMEQESDDGVENPDDKDESEYGSVPKDQTTPLEETEDKVQVMKAHFIIVEDKYIILFEENMLRPQRIPYGSCPLIIRPRSVVGVGVLEPVIPIQNQVNGFSSKQNDLVDQATNRLILYDDTSGLTGRTAFSRLNGLVPVTNVNGTKEFPSNPVTVQIIGEYIKTMKELMNDATGANEQFQGAEGADTLGEFQGLTAAAGSRFADIVDTMNQGFVENLADECFLFSQQFGVDGQMIVRQTAGDTPPISLTRQDLIGRYKFSAVSSATEGYKQKQIQDDTQFIGQMAEINQQGGFGPGDQPGTVKHFNIETHLKNVSLPLRGAKNSADQFKDVPLPPPPSPQPEQPRVSLSLNGPDAAAMGLTPAIRQDFGLQPQMAPMPPQTGPGMPPGPPIAPPSVPPTPQMAGGPNG